MQNYRMTYVMLHDSSGNALTANNVTLKDWVPALHNPVLNYLFLRHARNSAVRLNALHNNRVTLEFLVGRAKRLGLLYEEVPRGFKAKLKHDVMLGMKLLQEKKRLPEGSLF